LVVSYIVNYSPIGNYLDNKFRNNIKINQTKKPEDIICQQQSNLKTTSHNIFDTVDTRIIGPLLIILLTATIPLSIMRMTPVMQNSGAMQYDIFMGNM
jgi:hypothetical protein